MKNMELLTGKKDEKTINLLFDEKKSYEKATKTLREEIKTIWDAYNGEMTDKEYPWQSDKFIPKMRTEISYIMPFIFSGQPELEVEGIGDEDKFLAEQLEKIINYRFTRDLDAFNKISDWVAQSLTFGTSLIKVSWKFQTKDGKVKEDRTELTVPNILDIFLNPLIPTIEDQKSIIQRSTLTIKQLKNDPKYKNTKKVKPKGQLKSGDKDSSTLDSTDLDETEKMQTDMETVEVYERWSEDRIITVADGAERVLLRDEANPCGGLPYEKLIFEQEPLPNRFYGKGVGQNTIDLQAMYYDLFNQVMDNVKNLANKMYKIKRNVAFNPRDFISKPGGIIPVEDMGDVEPLEQTDIKQSAFEIMGLIGDEHKRASGANDLVQGAESGNTLGQDKIRESNSASRFDLVKRRFKNALASVGEKILTQEIENLQDINTPILRIFPAESREVMFDLIKSKGSDVAHNIKVKGETTLAMNKDIVRKQMIDLYNLAGETLTETESREFIREIMRLSGILNIDDLVSKEPMNMELEGATEGAIDGQAMPPVNTQPSQQSINQQTYGI